MAREPLRLLRATAQRARTAAVSPIRRFRRPSQTSSRSPSPAASPDAAAFDPSALDPTLRPRPLVRAAGLAAVTVLGAWIGLLVVGSVHISVGPMDTRRRCGRPSPAAPRSTWPRSARSS